MPFRLQGLASVTEATPRRLGQYDLVDVLGRGGMGMVFVGRERATGHEVAVKVMTWLDLDAERRFREEFRAACEARHENLVRLYELARDDDLTYFTMELVHGHDIVAWARRGLGETSLSRPTPAPSSAFTPTSELFATPTEARPKPASARAISDSPALRAVLAQVVQGVAALHARGILHLDLKPANVLVTERGRVVILDFGLSRPTARTATESNLLRGTPAYMAPEQARGLALTPAADLYAVGGILYEMLTGHPPFEGWGTSGLDGAKAALSVDAPDVLAPGAPSDLAALAMLLLQPDPAARPTASEVLLRLGVSVPDAREARVSPPHVFVGRHQELETLRRAMSDARTQRCLVSTTVRGPSGMGKTALVSELSRRLAADGVWLYGGRCYERERLPYKGVDEVVASLARHLRRLESERVATYVPARTAELLRTFPALATVRALAASARGVRIAADAHESRRAAWESLAEILVAIATRRPLALVLDDVQWIDRDASELLAFLARRLESTMTLVLFTRRDDEPEHDVPIVRAPMELSLRLAPLDTASSVELAWRGLYGANVDDAVAQRIAAESGGLPMHVQELARHVAERSSEADVEHASLEALLRERIAALAPGSRRLLATLAIADAPISSQLAVRAAGLGSHEQPLLYELVSARLARATRAGFLVHHDRVREVMSSMLSPTEDAERHLALARVLAVADTAHETRAFAIVRHHRAAGALEEGDRLAALEAAQRAADVGRSAGSFEMGLEAARAGMSWLRDGDWHEHRELARLLCTRAAELAMLASQRTLALELVAHVEASPLSPLEKTEAREIALAVHIADGALTAGLGLARQALAELGHPLPDRQRVIPLDRDRIESLRALPECTDASVSAAARIAERAFSAIYQQDASMRVAFGAHMVSLVLDHGLTPASPYALAVAATALNDGGREDLGHALGGFVRHVLPRFEERRSQAAAHLALDLYADVWVPPLADSLARLREDVDVARRELDFEYAARAVSGYLRTGFHAGAPIDELLTTARTWSPWLDAMTSLPGHALIKINLQLLHTLAGVVAPIAHVPAVEAGPLARAVSHLTRGVIEAHFGPTAQALEALLEAHAARALFSSHWHAVTLQQYLALVSVDAARAGLLERGMARELVHGALASMRHWAQVSPTNFGHRVRLIEAAHAELDGEDPASAYAEAAELARAGNWVHDHALVLERAGDREGAIAAYARWGAHGKVARLERGSPLFGQLEPT